MLVAGAAPPDAPVDARVQPVGARRARVVAALAHSRRPVCARRTRRTPPLKGMSALQRRKAVAGAFKVRDKSGNGRQDGDPGR